MTLTLWQRTPSGNKHWSPANRSDGERACGASKHGWTREEDEAVVAMVLRSGQKRSTLSKRVALWRCLLTVLASCYNVALWRCQLVLCYPSKEP